jgi:hypothetical protein
MSVALTFSKNLTLTVLVSVLVCVQNFCDYWYGSSYFDFFPWVISVVDPDPIVSASFCRIRIQSLIRIRTVSFLTNCKDELYSTVPGNIPFSGRFQYTVLCEILKILTPITLRRKIEQC